MDKVTILFADNDPDFLATRSEFLERAGYTVIPAHNLAEAQRKLEAGGIDLAILDIRLVSDGDEKDTSGLILAREVARSVPKVIQTGFPSTPAVLQALERQLDGTSAATGFLTKDEEASAPVEAVIRALAKPSTMTPPSAALGDTPRAGSEWLRLAASNASLLALLLAFGVGIVAIVTGYPGWLLGTILLAIASVLSSGLHIRR